MAFAMLWYSGSIWAYKMNKHEAGLYLLMLGAFSGQNKGDLAILRAELKELLCIYKSNIRISIATKEPASLSRYIEDIAQHTDSNVEINFIKSYTGYLARVSYL